MSSTTLHNLWHKSKSKGGPRLLMVCLADAADNIGYCSPSQSDLARRTLLSRRHIINMVHDLETMRELFVWRQKGKGNRYVVRSAISKADFLEAMVRHFWLDTHAAALCYETNEQPTSEKISQVTSEKISQVASEKISLACEADFTPHYNKEPIREEILLTVWDNALEFLRATTSNEAMRLHFQNAQLIKLNGETAELLVPSSYSASWINGRLQRQLNDALTHATGSQVKVKAVYE